MEAKVSLYSDKEGEISRFLNEFHKGNIDSISENALEYEFKYENPLEIADIIGSFIENDDMFDLTMWISIDKGVFIHVTDDNADDLIRYLYERFPY